MGEELLLSFNPGAPGLYVSVIFSGKDGKLRSVPFAFELLEQEPVVKPGENKAKGPPEDF